MKVTVPAKEERGRPDWVPDFAFAFDDSIFSDRILRIEILPDSPAGDTSGEPTLADSSGNSNRKRSRDPDPGARGCLIFVGEDNVVPGVLRVRNIHISSPILASRSRFFYKLFSNGMKESQQREVTLRIHASEEAVFLDLLNFMYCGTLSMSSPASLLDMLVAADKFEVASCVTECSSLLRELPMTVESALLYLDLPTSVSMGEAVQPLIDVAEQFLATHYRDIVKFPEEIFNLPLAGLEAVLSSDNLLVASEDYVFELVLEWARIHYPRSEDRQKVLTSRLFRFIRFPFMTREMLIKVLTCNDFDHEFAAKVLGALLFKGEPPHEHQILAENDANISHRHFVERAYKCRPIKVVEFERPHQQCIVYLDLKREELEHLSPSEVLYSETFRLGGQRFFLSAYRKMNQQSSLHCFGLYLTMKENGSASLSLDHEVAARQKPSGDFVSKRLRNYTFTTGSRSWGCRDLFGIPWETFISEDNTYFIDGILHLRAVLTIKK